MDSDMLQEISEDLLQCSICMDKYNQPKILPCIHTFCESCLEEYTRKPGAKAFSCPTCRTSIDIPEGGVKTFPTNFYIGNLEEKLQRLEGESDNKKTQKCGQCGNLGVDKFCKDCECVICADCAYAHAKWQMLKQHHITNIAVPESSANGGNETQASEKSSCEDGFTCIKHNGELLYLYCRTCGTLLCRKCAAGDHPKPSHDYVTAAVEVVKTRQALGQLLTKSDAMLDQCSQFELTHFKAFEKLHEDIQKIEKQMKVATDEAHMLIQSRQLSLMIELNRIEKEKGNFIHASIVETRSLRNHVEISQDLIQKLMEKPVGQLELLNVGGYLKDTFGNLQKYSDNVALISSESYGSSISFIPFHTSKSDPNTAVIGKLFTPICVEMKLADFETLDLMIVSQDETTLDIYVGRILKENGYSIREIKWIVKHEWESEVDRDVSKHAICMAVEPGKRIFIAQGKRIAVLEIQNGDLICSNEAPGTYQPFTSVSCIDYDEGTSLLFVGDESRRIEALNPMNKWHVSFFIEIPSGLVSPTRLVAHKFGAIFLSKCEPMVFQGNFRKQCGRLAMSPRDIVNARPIDITRCLSEDTTSSVKDQTLYENGRLQGQYTLKKASLQLQFSWFVLWVCNSESSNVGGNWTITEYSSKGDDVVALLNNPIDSRLPVAMIPISRDDGMEIIVIDQLMNISIFWRDVLDPEKKDPCEYKVKNKYGNM